MPSRVCTDGKDVSGCVFLCIIVLLSLCHVGDGGAKVHLWLLHSSRAKFSPLLRLCYLMSCQCFGVNSLSIWEIFFLQSSVKRHSFLGKPVINTHSATTHYPLVLLLSTHMTKFGSLLLSSLNRKNIGQKHQYFTSKYTDK